MVRYIYIYIYIVIFSSNWCFLISIYMLFKTKWLENWNREIHLGWDFAMTLWALTISKSPFRHTFGYSQGKVPPNPHPRFFVAILLSCPEGPMAVWPQGIYRWTDKGICGGLEHIHPYFVFCLKERGHTQRPRGQRSLLKLGAWGERPGGKAWIKQCPEHGKTWKQR